MSTNNNSNKKALGLISTIAIALITILIISLIFSEKTDNKVNHDEAKEDKAIIFQISQTMPTQYFDVTVNNIQLKQSISDYYFSERPDKGNVYLVINVTFKNTDRESRIILDGQVIFYINEQQYIYDKSESSMIKNYGLFMDQINPLTSKTTNLVYQIPEGISGRAYYHPGRTDLNKFIYLGDINTFIKR